MRRSWQRKQFHRHQKQNVTAGFDLSADQAVAIDFAL
jgi:hypothetical protein